jgi:hypothetical protein
MKAPVTLLGGYNDAVLLPRAPRQRVEPKFSQLLKICVLAPPKLCRQSLLSRSRLVGSTELRR